MEQLPDDMLAAVLGRLPPSSLAASRCVRKHWCSIIDARRLLPHAHLLPLRLDGIYCISLGQIERCTYLFARPSAARRRIPGGCLDFLEDYTILTVEDHCNGLLLACDIVVNPATRQWATLPIPPEPSVEYYLGFEFPEGTTTAMNQENERGHFLFSRYYLIYDPVAGSPQQFEVFLIPLLGRDVGSRKNITVDEQEWPPATFRTHVFSSVRWRWEERSWIRHGEPAGTMADMLQPGWCGDRKAVYFRGALYMQCQNDSVMRIALSNDKYQIVRPPVTRIKLGAASATFYLGKSEKGVYTALLYWLDWGSYPQFQVWVLKEEKGNGDAHHTHMEWVLKTNMSFEPLLAKPPHLHNGFADDDWRIIYDYNDKEEIPPAVAHGIDEFADHEWDFDNADIVLDEAKDNKAAEAENHTAIDFLGFHPYKEIVFFSLSSRTISYNLNTLKVQQLGGVAYIPVGIRTCFPYTPCLLTMGEQFENS